MSEVVPEVLTIHVSPPSVDFFILPLSPTTQPVFPSIKKIELPQVLLFSLQLTPPSDDLYIA